MSRPIAAENTEYVSDNVKDLQLQLAHANAEITRLTHTINALVNKKKVTTNDTTSNIDDLNWTNRVLRDENVDLAKKLAEVRKEVRSLQLIIYREERNAAAKREKDDDTILQKENAALKIQLREANAEIKTLKSSVQTHEKREIRLHAIMPELYRQLLQLGIIDENNNNNNQNNAEVVETVLKAVVNVNKRANEAEKLAEKTKSTMGGNQTKVNELITTNNQLKKTITSLKTELKNSKDQTKDLEEQLITFASEYEYLAREFHEKEKLLKNYENMKQTENKNSMNTPTQKMTPSCLNSKSITQSTINEPESNNNAEIKIEKDSNNINDYVNIQDNDDNNEGNDAINAEALDDNNSNDEIKIENEVKGEKEEKEEEDKEEIKKSKISDFEEQSDKNDVNTMDAEVEELEPATELKINNDEQTNEEQ